MTTTARTVTVQHTWVKHTITKVSTLPDLDDDRQIVVIEDPDDVRAAEDDAVYGCDVCGIPMEGNTDTLCDPVCHCGENFSNHTSEHNFVPMR
jgi:hypothetical protein